MGYTQKLGLLAQSVFQDSSLNVGIGAAPSGTYKLEVTGTAKVSSTLLLGGALSGTSATFSGSVTSNGTLVAGLANGNIRLKGSADGFLGVGESNGTLYLTDWTTGAKGLSIVLATGAATFSSSVNVVGTLVAGNASNVGKVEIGSVGSSSTAQASAYLRIGDEGAARFWLQQLNSSYDFTLRHFNSTWSSPLMTITSGGNVGIGIATPAYSLHNLASNQYVAAMATSSATGGYTSYRYNTSTVYGYIGNGNQLINGGLVSDMAITAESGNILFGTSSGTERMRITSGGTSTVLLGKTTSLYATTSRASLEINGVDTSILAWTRTNDATATAYIYYAADNNIYFQNNKAGGAIYIQSGNSGGVQLTAGSTAFAPQSDERLKNIQGNIENAIDKLSTLRTVIYSWKSDEENKENLGLIAQDVQKVFPQVIEKSIIKEDPINGISDDTTQYLSLKYTDLIPVLIKAIQEMNTKLDEQNQTIQNLQEQNQDLKSRLDKAGL